MWWGLFFVSFLSLWRSSESADLSTDPSPSPSSSSYDEKMKLYRSRIAQKYFHEIAQIEGIIRLRDGIYVEILKTGVARNAKSPRRKDRCKVSFTVKNKDGEVIEECESSPTPPAPCHAMIWEDLGFFVS